MSYSRRQLYAMGEPLGESVTRKEGGRIIYGGGGGGGPTQTNVTQSNVPDWLRPQVENVLMGAGKNLFQTKKVDSGQKNEDGTPIYNEEITGTKPFTPYSTDPSKYVAGFSPLQQQVQYNAANLQMPGQFNQATGYANQAAQGGLNTANQAAGYGNAGFQSGQMGQALGMQAAQQAAQRAGQAEQAAYGYGAQGQQSGLMGQQVGMQGGQMGIQGGARFGEMGAQAGLQGQQSGLQGQQIGTQGGQYYGGMGAGYGAQGAQAGANAGQLAQANANNLANNAYGYGDMGVGYARQGADLGTNYGQYYGAQGAGYGAQAAQLAPQAQMYGNQGAGYGSQAAQLANNALGYGSQAADIGRMGLRAESLGQDITGQARNYAAQQAAAGQQYAAQMTDPYAVQRYMNPYQSAVTDVQVAAAQRQADIATQGRKSAAARAGAFGGSRQAIENAEANRALATQQDTIRAQGQQAAYDKAVQAMQYGSNLGLTGLGGAQSGLGTALQGGQLGLSGIGQALAGQQAGMQGVGQAGSMYGLGMQGAQSGLAGLNAANQFYQTGMQGAGMGLQGLQQQLAGTAQGMQGSQIGLSAVDRANAAAQLSLSGADRTLAGTAQGMQGASMGLQGVDRSLAGTAQGMQGSQMAMQGAGVGLSGVDRQLAGVDRQLAGTAQGMQGAQVGLQGVDRALASGQLALSGADRGLAGTAQGMQGAQVGLQGVTGQQAGYGLANTAASNLANIGTQQLGAQTGILGLQNQIGGQQQSQQQQIINQAIQNYANAQNAPMDSFNQYNALLRGYALPGTTTTQYQSQPTLANQMMGFGTAGVSALALNNAMNPTSGSDVRVKENIERVGTLANGLGLYDFEYKPEFKNHPLCGYGRFRGVMAQEVEKLIPEAVVTMDNGYKAVKYDLVEMS